MKHLYMRSTGAAIMLLTLASCVTSQEHEPGKSAEPGHVMAINVISVISVISVIPANQKTVANLQLELVANIKRS